MRTELLSAGEFAKLARTTKRTVLWYDEKGILEPYHIDSKGYRFYKPGQIIDFQTVLLLRRLDFSLAEIEQYLAKGSSLGKLFKLKRLTIEQEIATLKRMLAATNTFYGNLDATGTLVKPKLKKIKYFEILYIEKTGPYAKIKDYCLELTDLVSGVSDKAVFLTAFQDHRYSPDKARMLIGIIATPRIKPKSKAVQRLKTPAHTALTYEHHGSGTLLSLLWKELDRYRRKQKLKLDTTLPFADIELYKRTSLNGEPNEDLMEFELQLPIVG